MSEGSAVLTLLTVFPRIGALVLPHHHRSSRRQHCGEDDDEIVVTITKEDQLGSVVQMDSKALKQSEKLVSWCWDGLQAFLWDIRITPVLPSLNEPSCRWVAPVDFLGFWVRDGLEA